MPTISACLVVWNGEKQIRDCLESIKNVVDDIVVVHDGPCRDRTLEICREYTKKVYVRPYVGEAEPHRPFTFAKASGDWILWIDQDERLSKPLQKALRKLAERADQEGVDAYTFRWPTKQGTKNLTTGFFVNLGKTVFFRKKALTGFRGLPNEVIKVTGKVVRTNYLLEHHQEGERDTLPIFFNRTLRIVRIHADQMLKKKLVTMPAPWYLLKAPLWLVLYLSYYYVLKGAFRTHEDRSIALQHALYNFFLYWYVFLYKTGLKKHKPGGF